MTNEKILMQRGPGLTVEQIATIAVPILRRYGVKSAAVFGSAARGEMGPDSDVDMLVEFSSNATLFTQAGLEIELTEAVGRDVEVVTAAGLKKQVRTQVLQELVGIYG